MLDYFKFKIWKEIIETKRGLIQGSVLSPLLFNIYINDLLKEYEDNKIYVRAYTDDIVWVCSNLEQTREAISIIKNWSIINKIVIKKINQVSWEF